MTEKEKKEKPSQTRTSQSEPQIRVSSQSAQSQYIPDKKAQKVMLEKAEKPKERKENE